MNSSSDLDYSDYVTSSTLEEDPIDALLPPSLDNANRTPLRSTRFFSGRELVILVALVAQVSVLAAVALIMGIAVMTMATVLGEIFVITAIATALERQTVNFNDLVTVMEVAATVAVTLLTIFLAATGSGSKLSESSIAVARYG